MWIYWLLVGVIFPALILHTPNAAILSTWFAARQSRRRRILFEMARTFRIPKVKRYFAVVGIMDDIDFFAHFRMKRSTMEILIRQGRPPPHPELRLTAEKEMIIFVWWIANTECYRAVADRFGISKSTSHWVVTRILKSIAFFMRDAMIQWPTGAARVRAARAFKVISGFPNVIGAVDGCHIGILPPKEQPDAYYNKDKFHSVILMAVCDARLMFTHISVGFPGRAHDARAFERSRIGDDVEQRYGQHFYILGDSAFTLTRSLIPPYKGVRANPPTAAGRQKKKFNKLHSKGRVVIEQIFGAIDSKMRKLQHMEHRRLDLILLTVEVACILHNFITLHEGRAEPIRRRNNGHGAVVPVNPRDGPTYRDWLARHYAI